MFHVKPLWINIGYRSATGRHVFCNNYVIKRFVVLSIKTHMNIIKYKTMGTAEYDPFVSLKDI